jgi:hypothetical protein
MHKIRIPRLLLFAVLILAIPAASFGQIFFSVTIAPPPLPVYVQPVCPQVGYMWTPGYWSWSDDDGYFWVPGTWVPAPEPGLLWTPGYWGWEGGVYRLNQGYWGPHVGYYGGVNYGFGFGGIGFAGGEWRGGAFFYNTAAVNVGHGGGFTNVYVNKTVVVNNTTIVNNVSYNGPGGATAKPTPAEQQAAQEHHVPPTPVQTEHVSAAAKNPQLLAKNNGGKPAIAATAKPADFSPKSVVPAKAAGGKVDPASLKATAKTMPPPSKTSPTPGKNEPAAKAPAAAPHTSAAPAPHPAPAPPKPAPAVRPAPTPRPAPAPHAATPAARPAPTPRPAPAPHAAAPASRPAPAAHPSAPPKPPPPKPAPSKPAPKEEKEKH